jgi:hypothetical protein
MASTQANITIEAPLPIPSSVIRSPSQRRTIVPAVIIIIAGRTTPQKFVVSIMPGPHTLIILFRRYIIP